MSPLEDDERRALVAMARRHLARADVAERACAEMRHEGARGWRVTLAWQTASKDAAEFARRWSLRETCQACGEQAPDRRIDKHTGRCSEYERTPERVALYRDREEDRCELRARELLRDRREAAADPSITTPPRVEALARARTETARRHVLERFGDDDEP